MGLSAPDMGAYDARRSGQMEARSAPGRGVAGGLSGGGRGSKMPANAAPAPRSADIAHDAPEMHVTPLNGAGRSYLYPASAASA